MKIYTIGFTQKSASQFFETLKLAKVSRLVDVRLNNSSQLCAFAKKNDLAYFMREICHADYLHLPLLAPTQEMLDQYKKQGGTWATYAGRFLDLMKERRIEDTLDPAIFDAPSVLLCSEHMAEHCHRTLVLQYLQKHWSNLEIIHL